MLFASEIVKTYPSGGGITKVLDGVSLSIGRGESLALMGESGSGKSTLLHLIAGLDLPDSGQIMLDGAEMSAASDSTRAKLRLDKTGVIFQQFNLIPSLTVAANIAFQAQLAGRYDPDWCSTLTQRLGLAEQLHKFPEALSGGQQQRVAIARALAGRPALVLADEPTGNLDEATAARVLSLLLELTAEAGIALLMVTHSAQHAGRLARQVSLRGGVIR